MPLASRTGEVKYRIKGTPGADAYNLITTVSQVYQTATGTFNPNSFTAYAYQGKELAVGMYLQCWGSSDNENWTYISYRQITLSNTGLTVNVSSSYKYYIVRLYDHNPSINIDAEPNFLASATVPVIKDGEPGAQGNPGAKMRMRTWASGTYYMRGVGTEEWYDVVEYESRLYLCRVSHTASSSNSPATDTGYWEIAQNWTFIATKLLLAERIKANQIESEKLVSKQVYTEPLEGSQAHVEIQGSEINIFGNVTRNIQFGVNEDGLAVMRYYDNNGRLLYDLGPDGITQVPVTQEQWIPVWLQYLGTSLSSIMSSGSYKNWNYADSNKRYRYQSKMVAGVYDDPDNNGKVFNYQSKTSPLSGYYITAPNRAGTTPMWLQWQVLEENDQRFTKEDMHPNNPYVVNRSPIYVVCIEHYTNGKKDSTQNVYWNG